ncbi:MAG: DUF4082 domain-containing protein [Fibrobacteres bacterium]|nr:DUF4082 domain-containing protein [Fibrobacterota bacterium]
MRMLLLIALIFQTVVSTENWVLSGQSNAARMLTVFPNLAKPIMAAGGVPFNFAGSGYDGQSIKVWTLGGLQWTPLQRDLEFFEEPVDVFIWYQGEANGYADKMTSDQYLDSLRNLVSHVRNYGHNQDMTVVICQIGSVVVDSASESLYNYPPIRDAQQRFVALDSNAILLPNMGRSLSDLVHLNITGQTELINDMTKAIMKFRHGKESQWPGPVLDAAVVNGANGIKAHFAEAVKLSGFNILDYALSDTDGLNPCTTIADSGNTTVSLLFERPVKLPAKLIYGPGCNAPAKLRDEAGFRAPHVQLPVTTGTIVDKQTFAPNGAANRHSILNDTLPITSFQVYSQSSSIEPYTSTELTAVATRNTGRVDTVTAACSYYTLSRAVASTKRNRVVGQAAGVAQIRISMITPNGTVSDTVTITVTPSTATFDSLSLSLDSLELIPEDNFKLRAKAYYHKDSTNYVRAIDSEAVWSVSDTSKASVIKGVVTSKSEGISLIIATFNGKSDTCRFKGYAASNHESLLTTQLPQSASTSANALGTIITFTGKGRIVKARIYSPANDSGLHIVRIWRMSNSTIAAGPYRWTFSAAPAGWRTFPLPNPVNVLPGERYMVEVTTPLSLPFTTGGFASKVTNGNLSTAPSAGVYSSILGLIPAKSYNTQNYFRDVVFEAENPVESETIINSQNAPLLFVYPNPFNPTISISLLSSTSHSKSSTISIYDISGKAVANLSKELNSKGTIVWNGADLSSGAYIIRYKDGLRTITKQILLQR